MATFFVIFRLLIRRAYRIYGFSTIIINKNIKNNFNCAAYAAYVQVPLRHNSRGGTFYCICDYCIVLYGTLFSVIDWCLFG